MEKSFVEWLQESLRRRSWSQADLMRQSGISDSAISLVLSGQRNPGVDFCSRIAQAFGVDPGTVLRLAGLIPSDGEEATAAPLMEAEEEEVLMLFRSLDPPLRKAMLLTLQSMQHVRCAESSPPDSFPDSPDFREVAEAVSHWSEKGKVQFLEWLRAEVQASPRGAQRAGKEASSSTREKSGHD